jgi:hypothetical protein
MSAFHGTKASAHTDAFSLASMLPSDVRSPLPEGF